MIETSWMYRGWRVVVLAALAMVATLPGRTVGLGLITEPLLNDLDVSRTFYATLTFWATILGASFSLACGPAIDRWGVRRVLPTVLLLVGITTAWMGTSVTAGSLLIFLILSRGFGQSSLSTASVTAVGKWFTTGLGIALGVFSALVAFGFASAIPALGGAITPENWRSCWTALGLIIAAFGFVTLATLPRSSVAGGGRLEEAEMPSTPWRTAMTTGAFWLFTLSTALYYLVLSGLTLFNEAVIAELGFDRGVFIAAMAAMMGAGLVGNFLYGWLASRVTIPRLLSINLALLAIVLLSFPWLTSPTRVILHAALYGTVGGAFAVLFFTGYGHAFGQRHLGKIQGTAQVLGVIASALGPSLLANTEASTGSFLPAFRWLGPVAIVFAVIAWLTAMPTPTATPVTDNR